jgi:hypothetical protein
MADDLMHLDSGESIFFTRELETIRAKTYDIKYDDNFKMLSTIPISMEGDPLDIDITHRSYGRVGIAKMGGGDYATDFPSVDIFATETTVKVYPIQASYRYNKDEIARAAKMNRPLESKRADAARKAIEKKANDVATSGDTLTGAKGFFNASGTSTYTVPDGTSTTTDWEHKTSDEILKDLFGISNGIIQSTKGIEVPDTIAIPLSSYQLIEQKRLADETEKTVLQYFLDTTKNIKNVIWFNELETITTTLGLSGYDSTKGIYCWKNTADTLVFDMPMDFTQEEVMRDGLAYVIPCKMKVGGVVLFFPLAVARGFGI